MANRGKKRDTHTPSCPFRAPAIIMAGPPKRPKQSAQRRGDGEDWPQKKDMRGGYRPSGAAEVMAAGKPIKAVAFKAAG